MRSVYILPSGIIIIKSVVDVWCLILAIHRQRVPELQLTAPLNEPNFQTKSFLLQALVPTSSKHVKRRRFTTHSIRARWRQTNAEYHIIH
jgi:hypothetical protein